MNESKHSKTRTLLSFDYAAKRLLRDKSGHEVLEGFLSEVLGRHIRIEEPLESESNQETRDDKFNRVDMLVRDEDREYIIVEVQFTEEIDYFHRMLYGTSKIITDRIRLGDDYITIRKVYSINVVYFNLGIGNDYIYHGRTRFLGIHTRDELQLDKEQRLEFGRLTAGELYPEYYILKVRGFNDVIKDTLDEWMYYLKHECVQEDFTAQGLKEASDILAVYKLPPEERKAYEKAKYELSHIRSEYASAQARIKRELNRVQEKKLKLQIENKELQTEKKELQNEKKELQTEKKELQNEKKELQDEKKELQAKTEELQSENKELQAKAKELQVKTEKIVLNCHRKSLPVAAICELTGLTEEEIKVIINSIN